jgi:hypothetical protein
VPVILAACLARTIRRCGRRCGRHCASTGIWGTSFARCTQDPPAHGATDRIPLAAYTAAFLDGYRRGNDLLAADAAAIPLFQRLRIASRACYVTDPDALVGVRAWLQRALGE